MPISKSEFVQWVANHAGSLMQGEPSFVALSSNQNNFRLAFKDAYKNGTAVHSFNYNVHPAAATLGSCWLSGINDFDINHDDLKDADHLLISEALKTYGLARASTYITEQKIKPVPKASDQEWERGKGFSSGGGPAFGSHWRTRK